MKQDKHKTKVAFRVFPEGDVVALFYDEVQPDGTIGSCQHVGQHGAASLLLMKELRVATPKEYQALKKELVNMGYNLQVKR